MVLSVCLLTALYKSVYYYESLHSKKFTTTFHKIIIIQSNYVTLSMFSSGKYVTAISNNSNYDNFATFKKKLKTHLFDNAFPNVNFY